MLMKGAVIVMADNCKVPMPKWQFSFPLPLQSPFFPFSRTVHCSYSLIELLNYSSQAITVKRIKMNRVVILVSLCLGVICCGGGSGGSQVCNNNSNNSK